jgi:predicted anti-sigma-YlaC factor YlaD
MEITRNIILDLLPLYLDGDASPDTQALVEKYLEADPEFAEMAEQFTLSDKPEDVPVLLKKEKQMKAYEEAQRLILQRTLVLGAIIALVILSLLGVALLVISMFVSVQ